jgi:hypothetical protein
MAALFPRQIGISAGRLNADSCGENKFDAETFDYGWNVIELRLRCASADSG